MVGLLAAGEACVSGKQRVFDAAKPVFCAVLCRFTTDLLDTSRHLDHLLVFRSSLLEKYGIFAARTGDFRQLYVIILAHFSDEGLQSIIF
jgi:hypothetical protein